MAAFVTVNEYFAYYGAATSDTLRIQADLDAACDRVRDYLCQQVDEVVGDVVTVYGTGTRALLLPELPVTAVTSVTLDGEAVTDFTVDGYGLLWRDYPTDATSSVWAKGYGYEVTYSHGYAVGDVPAILKVVALQLAKRSPSTGLRQESIADYSATYTTDVEDSLLASLDRRVVKKVPTP